MHCTGSKAELMMASIPEQVQSLLDVYNWKRNTSRFQSVDQVAEDLRLPPRPPTEVLAWISLVAQAVADQPQMQVHNSERSSRWGQLGRLNGA